MYKNGMRIEAGEVGEGAREQRKSVIQGMILVSFPVLMGILSTFVNPRDYANMVNIEEGKMILLLLIVSYLLGSILVWIITTTRKYSLRYKSYLLLLPAFILLFSVVLIIAGPAIVEYFVAI